MSLVLKNEAGIILKMKNGVREFRILLFASKQKKAATHSEMGNKCLAVVEIEKYMLATAADEVDRCVFEVSGEFLRPDIRREALSQKFSGSDTPLFD